MKIFTLVLIAFCIPVLGFSQDISGLWKGTMYNDSTQKSLPYELYIVKENGKYTGYTHSWFLVNGKEYYGIKKVKVRMAKDGKVVIQDATLIENNYPIPPDNVSQLNVLDLGSNGADATMDGPFVTNRTKTYTELTGRINIKRAINSSGSALMDYLAKSGIESNLTVSK